MSRELVGQLDFPIAWLDGKRWLLGPELVRAIEIDQGGHAAIVGGVLSDGTNVLGLSFPGGQRLMRISPDTDWAIEEHFDGPQPTHRGVLKLWQHTVESMRLGLADARQELGG